MWRGLQVGEILAHRYRVTEWIGEGGMGRVFAAEDLRLTGKKWAIKEIGGGWQGSGWGRQEAERLLQLDHPRLPQVVDYYHFAEIGCTYLVMELIKGQTLQQIFEKNDNRMEEEFLLPIVIQLCEVFDYLHHLRPQPLVYRDLKPGNVMLDQHGQSYLIDFGISRSYKEGEASDTVLMGSPGFVAPEQRLNQQTDMRTDLYHLGAMMYYLLSGGRYYKSYHMDEFPQLGHECIQSVIAKLLCEDPNDRYQTAADVRRELLLAQGLIKGPEMMEDVHKKTSEPFCEQTCQYIVVGSLYHGAGATYTAMNMARILGDNHVECAVVEYSHHPEYLYRFGMGSKEHKAQDQQSPELRIGKTVWYPLDTESSALQRSVEEWYRFLLFLKAPVVMIDIGTHWSDPFVQKLVQHVDHIAVLIDPQPHKWQRRDVEDVLSQLMDCRKQRDNVHIIANRSDLNRTIWSSFPLPIALKHPDDGSKKRKKTDAGYYRLLRSWGLPLSQFAK